MNSIKCPHCSYKLNIKDVLTVTNKGVWNCKQCYLMSSYMTSFRNLYLFLNFIGALTFSLFAFKIIQFSKPVYESTSIIVYLVAVFFFSYLLPFFDMKLEKMNPEESFRHKIKIIRKSILVLLVVTIQTFIMIGITLEIYGPNVFKFLKP